MLIKENKKVKLVKSNNYNYFFNKENGFFARWGETQDVDPVSAPLPEILDLEISQGKCSGNCPECYKCNGNTEEVYNMSFETFVEIFHKVAKTVVRITFEDGKIKTGEYNSSFKCFSKALSKQEVANFVKSKLVATNLKVSKVEIMNIGLLTQIAFGICDLDTNPDFLKMMCYCREFDVIPNFTFNGNGLTEELADQISKVCGAVAVSNRNKQNTYNSIKMLTDRGMSQINIHAIVHDKSYKKILETIDDMCSDARLTKMNALVLLRYKPKGNGVGNFKQLSLQQYRDIIEYANSKNVNIGFDSCSAPIYLQAIDETTLNKTKDYVEPCESALFSSYINCKGDFYACSFCEGEGMWKQGISVLDSSSFDQVWNHEKTTKFRELLLNNCRKCPMFNLGDY